MKLLKFEKSSLFNRKSALSCSCLSLTAVAAFAYLGNANLALSIDHHSQLELNSELKTDGNFQITREFKVTKPAFLRTVSRSNGSISLYISSFNVLGGASVLEVSNMADMLQNSTAPALRTVLDGIKWPNEVNPVSFPETFGNDFLAVADGFLVPTKQTGGIYLINHVTGEATKISTDKAGWFYHRAMASDYDGDGKNDILTARAKTSMFGAKTQAEFVVLKNPGSLTEKWEEEVLIEGPDVMFEYHDINGDEIPEIVATQFFSRKFAVYSRGAEKDSPYALVFEDNTVGKAFDLQIADINADGKKDIIVTNHENDEKASVFAYEVPFNLKDAWTRHTLSSGFVTKQGGINAGSPGTIQVFQLEVSETKARPWILISGDGSQKAHLLRPESEEASNWKYTTTDLIDTGATVGQSTVVDLNNDGIVELLIPAYDKDTVTIMSFKK